MYLDRRLWTFTRGVRLRIAGTVLLGLLAVGAGIARLALFGWLLGRVIAGDPPPSLLPLMALAAAAVALVLLAAALVTLIAPSLWHRKDSRQSLARQKAYAAFGAEFLDSVQGLATLRAFGQSGARGRLLEEKGHALFRSTMGALGANTFARGITDTGVAVGAAAALSLGAWRVQAGEMSLTALLVILMLSIEVFRQLRELRVVLHQGMLGLSAAGGIIQILEAEPRVRDRETPLCDAASLAPAVRFEGVTFSYPGGRRAAHLGLSFEVAAGERVGIVGPSGAGKSTIARLLLRFYDPESGRITIGGRDLRDLTLDQPRGLIAVVSQDTYLFNDTLRNNVLLARPEATDVELAAAVEQAALTEFAARLPDGLDTVVGERGAQLSGGQRQRVAIARAFLKDAPILILDEATSHLDAVSEQAVRGALDLLARSRTTLVIAHRLSTVRSGQRIIVLEDGRVAETGSHRELLDKDGLYAHLVSRQLASATGAPA